MTVFLHYFLVSPDYQHQGIASQLVEKVKAHYKDFFYTNVMPRKARMSPSTGVMTFV